MKVIDNKILKYAGREHEKEIFANVIGYKKRIQMLSGIFQDFAALQAETARGPHMWRRG